MRLKDKVAIVTGGGRGIGAATARRFLAEGALVEVWDVSAALAQSAAAVLGGAEGALSAASFHAEVVDVTDQEGVRAAVGAAIARRGRIDILVNNAGIIADGFASDLPLADWERVLRVNLTGTFLPAQAVIPHLRERRGGVIVNTSSTSALGNKGQANYAASKAGVIGLTRTLALELARDGIRVNCVAPGAIDTEMFRQVPEKVREKFLAAIPLGRFGRPEEVANLHLFLASDESAYMTGQTIFCDGGISL
jgi:3-oxoacyl-[acyl-carrier protein] reductase